MHSQVSSTTQQGVVSWLIFAAAFPLAAFEAISVYATLAGAPAGGAIGGLVVFAALAFGLAVVFVPAADRHRVLSTTAIIVSALALVSVVALSGKIAAARGVLPGPGTIVQALLLLTFQLGWALTYRLSLSQETKSQSRFIPAAVGGVVLIIGGLMTGGVQRAAPVADAVEKFVTHPRLERVPFVRETERAGNDERGAGFAHYHTGQLPLLGITFSTRDWMRRERIDADLRGIFDREAPVDGDHVLLARPGYAVAAVETRSGDHVNALRVQFSLLEGGRLSLDDTYWSEWVGSKEIDDDRTDLESYRKPVLGISGSKGMVLNSMSLLVAR